MMEEKKLAICPVLKFYCIIFYTERMELYKLLVYSATAVAQWFRRCATNRKVAGSIPDGVIGIFH